MCFDAKIYHIIPYSMLGTDALRVLIKLPLVNEKCYVYSTFTTNHKLQVVTNLISSCASKQASRIDFI